MDEALAQDVPLQLIANSLWEDDVLAARAAFRRHRLSAASRSSLASALSIWRRHLTIVLVGAGSPLTLSGHGADSIQEWTSSMIRLRVLLRMWSWTRWQACPSALPILGFSSPAGTVKDATQSFLRIIDIIRMSTS